MRAGVESAGAFCWLSVAFGLNTAMRHSEILAARFDKIDFDKLRLIVPDITGVVERGFRRSPRRRFAPSRGWSLPAAGKRNSATRFDE
jgi:integrase